MSEGCDRSNSDELETAQQPSQSLKHTRRDRMDGWTWEKQSDSTQSPVTHSASCQPAPDVGVLHFIPSVDAQLPFHTRVSVYASSVCMRCQCVVCCALCICCIIPSNGLWTVRDGGWVGVCCELHCTAHSSTHPRRRRVHTLCRRERKRREREHRTVTERCRVARCSSTRRMERGRIQSFVAR